MDVTGHLDLCGPELVEGWIIWLSQPQRKMRLQVFLGDQLLGECVADLFRQDLCDAGLGDGHCAFSFRVPGELTVRDPAAIRLRLTGSVLYLLPDKHTSLRRPDPQPALTGNWARARTPEPQLAEPSRAG